MRTGPRFLKLFFLTLLMGGAMGWWRPFDSRGQSPGKSFTPTLEWRPTHVVSGAQYVGNNACAECHVETQNKTPMSEALELARDARILQAHPRLTFKSGNYVYSIVRQGQQSLYSVTDGQTTLSAPILYAFGQGKAGQTYVLERNGKYYESRVSFYQELGGLDFTLGVPREATKSLEEAFGRMMDSLDAKDCFSCHATAAVSEGRLQVEKMAPGITCEGCHGAGGEHVALMKKPKNKTATQRAGNTAILNPGRFDTEGQTQFCGSCHRTWTHVQLMKASGVVNVRFQPYRIFSSKCYDFEDQRIRCAACHNPHEPMKTEAAHYTAKCVACHRQASGGETLRVAALCKAGKTTDCIACHMPQYEIPGSHHKFTDHYIRIVRAGESYPN